RVLGGDGRHEPADPRHRRGPRRDPAADRAVRRGLLPRRDPAAAEREDEEAAGAQAAAGLGCAAPSDAPGARAPRVHRLADQYAPLACRRPAEPRRFRRRGTDLGCRLPRRDRLDRPPRGARLVPGHEEPPELPPVADREDGRHPPAKPLRRRERLSRGPKPARRRCPLGIRQAIPYLLAQGDPAMADKMILTDAEWRERLTPEQYRSCASTAPSARSPANTRRTRHPAHISAPGADSRCSRARTSTTAVLAGRASCARSRTRRSRSIATCRTEWSAPKLSARAARGTSATSSPTVRPTAAACATASTAPRSTSGRRKSERRTRAAR